MEYGLQTFTVRALMKSESELDALFLKLGEFGINFIELAADYIKFPFKSETANMLRRICDKNGIKIASAQIKYKTVADDYDNCGECMNILGAKIVTNSVIELGILKSGDTEKGMDAVLRYCETLNTHNEELKKRGLTLAHHNHHYEFLKFGNKNVLEILAENYAGMFALDTFWCQKGGGNVLTLLEKLSGRVPLMHLRDFKVEPFNLFSGGKDSEVGKGNIPFREIIEKAKQTGVEYGMIEQNTKTPLESVEYSAKTVSGIIGGL